MFQQLVGQVFLSLPAALTWAWTLVFPRQTEIFCIWPSMRRFYLSQNWGVTVKRDQGVHEDQVRCLLGWLSTKLRWQFFGYALTAGRASIFVIH